MLARVDQNLIQLQEKIVKPAMRAVVGCRNDFRNESPGFSSLGLIPAKPIQRFRILLARGSIKEFGSFSRVRTSGQAGAD